MGDNRTRLILLAAIYALTALGVYAAARHRLEHRPVPDWSTVPYSISGWKGVDAKFDPVYGGDPADSSLLRAYSRASGVPVFAYAGFSEDLPNILDVHTPELCYPAQGWLILSSSNTASRITARAEMPGAQEILVEKNGERRMVRWWYMAGLRPFQNRIRYVSALLALSTVTGRTDGTVVRLETPVSSDGEASAEARIGEFERDFAPKLADALPH